MSYFLMYAKATGVAEALYTCDTAEQVTDAGWWDGTNNGLLEVPAQIVPNQVYVRLSDMTVQPIPAAPGPGWVWSGTAWTDARTLDVAKAQAEARLQAGRDVLEYADVTVGAYTYAADPDSQRRIGGAVTMAILSEQTQQPFSITWTLADGVSTTTLNATQQITLGLAIAAQVQGAFDKYRTAQAALAAATTNAQVDAVTL